jgi:hypothetical protein
MLSILNNGSDSAHIVGASISNAHFSLPEGSVFSIGAHSRKDVHLVFLPTAAVPEAGTLDFSVLNPGSARLTIRLTGSGVDRPLEVKNPAGIFPEVFALYQNYPNPFNPVTTIRYAVPVGGVVSLKVYDILGTEVATLVEGMQVPGYKSVSWNASSTSSGIYFCRLTAGNFSAVEKLLLIK